MRNTINVLIIDDQEEVANLFADMFRGASFNIFKVNRATSLGVAKDLCNTSSYDVAILDLYLRESRELDTLERYVALFPHLPVVVITGHDREGLAFDCFRLGASDFLTKPNISIDLLERACFYAVERYRAERAQRVINLTLESVLNIAPVGIGMAVEREIKWVNDRMCELVNLDRSALEGSNARILYGTEEEFNRIGEEKYPEVYIEGRWSDETKWVTSDGEIKDILLSSSIIGEGSPSSGLIFTALDITSIKNANRKIQAERDKVQNFLDIAGTMILAIDLDGSISLINQKGCEILGYDTAEELIGKNWFEKCILPSEREEVYNVFKAVIAGDVLPDKAKYFENHVVRKDGSVRLIAWNNTYVLDNCTMVSLSSGEDITDRVLLQSRQDVVIKILKLLTAPYSGAETVEKLLKIIRDFTQIDAVAIRLQDGADYPYFVYNGFSEDFIIQENFLCQVDSEGCPHLQPDGKPVLSCMCGCVIRGHTDSALPCFTDRGSFWTNSTTELLEGNHIDLPIHDTRNVCNIEGYESVAIIPLKINDDEIIGSLQLNDRRKNIFSKLYIEFLEELALSIAVAVKRSWQEDRIKYLEIAKTKDLLESSRLLNAGIAHELRTPMQAIFNSLELIALELENDCELQARYLTDGEVDDFECPKRKLVNSLVDDGISRAEYSIKVLNSLSEYSKIATSEETHLINVVPELETIIRTLRFTDSFKGLEQDRFRVDSYLESDCSVQMDKVDFSQLFINLCRNASEAIVSEDPCIIIEVRAKDQSTAEIKVVDNGRGIDPSLGDRIFEPYFSTKENPEGYNQGLGLAMVRDIVAAYGGKISYKSEPGHTEFNVEFSCERGG